MSYIDKVNWLIKLIDIIILPCKTLNIGLTVTNYWIIDAFLKEIQKKKHLNLQILQNSVIASFFLYF